MAPGGQEHQPRPTWSGVSLVPGRPRSAPQRATPTALWISIGRCLPKGRKSGGRRGGRLFGVNAARAGRAGPLERLKPRAEDPSVTGERPGFIGQTRTDRRPQVGASR